MKRLLAAGYERLFQICHCWRSGERGRHHLPEYTMLEWYRSHCDYQQLMTDCEAMLLSLVPAGQIIWHETTIDLTPPWPRLSVEEAFKHHSSISLEEALANDLFDSIMTEQIEPQLDQLRPVFCVTTLYSMPPWPAKSLTMPMLPNGWSSISGARTGEWVSELNDPIEQRQRFSTEEEQRRQRGKSPYPSPLPFLEELECLPDSAGIALGIDRLIMLLCDIQTIDNVVFFTPENL